MKTETRRAWIGLGSNLSDPVRQVRAALRRIAALAEVQLVAQSSLYRSRAVGPGLQDDYCNAVCLVATTLSPQSLLDALLGVERAMGRQRDGTRWTPRLIDLDLLHYEGARLDQPSLTLPHPQLAQRNFMLVPLAEVSPDLEVPGLGRADALAGAAGEAGLSRWPAQ